MAYMGAILDNRYMLDIPTSPEELATLLDTYAPDWGIVLSFLDTVAIQRGVRLDVHEICKIMKRKYGIDE